MAEKLTLEQFQQIKDELKQIIEQYENFYATHKNDENFDNKLIEQKFISPYLEIQSHLLDYDLSDIPFLSWQDFFIMSDESKRADFSKTRANIDFGLVEYGGNGNFKGCNVRGLDKIQRYLNPNDFDEQTIQMNSSLFLSDIFSKEFKDKYYNNSLNIGDLANLSSEQLAEVKQKNFKSHMNFDFYNDQMLEILGLDKVILLYNHSPQEYEAIKKIIRMYSFKEEFLEQIKNINITDIKKFCFNFARGQILDVSSRFHQEDFPELFVSENADIFLVDANISDEVKERYFNRSLKIQDLLDYPEVFKNIPIDNFMSYDIYIVQFIKDNYGKGKFQDLVERNSDIFAYLIKENDLEQFSRFLKEEKDLESAFVDAVKQYFLYLINKDRPKYLPTDIKLVVAGLIDEQGHVLPNYISFIDEYVSRYGNKKMLDLISKYGVFLSGITISSLHDEISDEKLIEQSIRKSIYKKIISSKIDYTKLLDVAEMKEEYPEIFVNFDSLTSIPPEERQRLTTAFYERALTFGDIMKYPELATVLKDKDLFIVFGNKAYSDSELIETLGNDRFLKLCIKYGNYMYGMLTHLNNRVDLSLQHLNDLSLEEISSLIEDIIIKEVKLGNLSCQPEDAPAFLKEYHPELFLSDDAPEGLKKYFYYQTNWFPLTFEVLQKHKEWLPFLKDKALVTSLLRNRYFKQDMINFFEVFGEDKAIKLGINRAETVTEMIKSHQVDLMKSWYDKTGGKFIPDFVVMQNFGLEQADKFLSSGVNWSKLMKINSFASVPESREAMLKLAYSFGAFDQDQRGFKKLLDLLTGLPKKIDLQYGYIIERIDEQIEKHSQRGIFYHNVEMSLEEKEEAYNKMIEYVKNNSFGDFLDTNLLVNFLEVLKRERVDIDFSKPIFSQIYRKKEDGTYFLTINSQVCQKSAQAIREILEKFRELPILNPDQAHQLFGGFTLKYDADFREFLLANMDKIMENNENAFLLASVQKQFSDIKTINSNRALTWELAASYVQKNKFTSVNVGNEKVAEISSIAGYSQTDFEVLQQIYNYGKQRTFSSIPRTYQSTKKKSGNYTYETLRLDDPLAMAIGTLTDCCQELNNCAEVCMEHSMVDKNGRVFVIKDEEGNIMAQSWVWRNKDVLCFDNIEIPDKAFARVAREHPELGRKGFTDEIFEIYKQAAKDLIEEDEKVYKKLLESGKITQEQYDGLRLGKITVGLGYNDIAESLKQNSKVDKGDVSRPLPFVEPVKLSRGIYTNDSVTQYILEERDGRKSFEGETIPVHRDTYVEYSDTNFTEKALLTLEKLELVTKEDARNLEICAGYYTDPSHIVTEIAQGYGLNPEMARIVMNPNFAIIYDVNGNILKIGDLLFNTKIDNGPQQMDIEKKVAVQIRLAIDQILGDREIDVSSLNEKQKDMYRKVTGLNDEIDIERGVGHAR